MAIVCASAADVTTYAVIKNRLFDQTAAATVVPTATNGFTFTGVVNAATSNMTSGTLQPPSLTVYTFTNTPGLGSFGLLQTFSSQAAMDAVFASGNYKFTLNTVHDGTKTPTLSMTGDNYPAAPTIANYAQAQLIGAGTNFTVSWVPFTGGTSTDTILLTIANSTGQQVFSTPVFPAPGALTGTATSAVIPANTLQTGRTYTATLSFAKVTADVFSYLGVPGVSAYASSTTCKLRTLSTPLLTIEQTAANEAQLSFNSDTGRSYDIRASVDLTNWTSLLITNAAGTNVIYQDASSPALTNRFYRLQNP